MKWILKAVSSKTLILIQFNNNNKIYCSITPNYSIYSNLDAYTDSDLLLMWRAAAFAFEIEAPNFYVGMDKTETYTIKTGSGKSIVIRINLSSRLLYE